MPDIIQLLPDHVANQIAAGEVVQRPASVVKELIENSIDAGATEITLVVKDAGKTLIQVIDNGKGMSTTDARLCFERHATSKIKSAEDLFNLNTKGFRGEALSSIAAIAHVEMKTKTEAGDMGSKIIIEGSKVVSQGPEVIPTGTTISVKNLFYNIPARRNFLKSNAVETRHIIDEFHRVALAHPQVKFSMMHNGSNVFSLPESNERQRIVNIFGNKTNEKLVPVSEETEIVKVNGFVLKPEFSRKSRGEQFFFVNDRFIKSPYLNHAVNAAFEGLIKDGYHPGYFLFLDVDPTSIDINIHPTKTEIKFDDEHAIYAMLRATIKHALGQFSIAPVLDFDKDEGFETPYEYSKKSPVAPTIEVDRNFNPFSKDTSGSKSVYRAPKRESSWESLYVGLKDQELDLSEGIGAIELESEEVTGRLFEEKEQDVRTFFQLQQKYIVSPIKSGLMVIHQNLAHQRILYEELFSNITIREGISQQLLFNLEMDLNSSEVAILAQIKEQLENTGFVFESLAGDQCVISGLPAGLDEKKTREVIHKLIANLGADIPDSNFELNDLLAKSMAAAMAVKSGAYMSKEEQEQLVHRLFGCKEPGLSPNNQPVLTTIDISTIDNKFK